MKKKLLLAIAMLVIMVFTLAFLVSAEEITVNTITSETYGTIYQLSADPGLDNAEQYKSTLNNINDLGTDEDALCILYDGTYYYVFPSTYIVKEITTGNQIGKFEVYVGTDTDAGINNAITEWNTAEGTTLPTFTLSSTWGNRRIEELVRFEFTKDVTFIDRDHCCMRSYPLLKEVRFPYSVSLSRARSLFSSCKNLTTVVGFENLTNLTDSSYFTGCTALKTVKLPSDITTIPGYIFNGCTSFTGVENWDSIKDNITSIGDNAFYGCESLVSLDVDNGKLTSIGGSAFYNCTGLTSIKLPNTVTSIGGSCFFSCSGLTSFDVPDSLVTLGSKTFQGCSGITRLEFPPTTTSFGQDCFNGCTALEYINIPRDCTYIGNYTFAGCEKVSIDMSGAKSLKSTGTNNSWGVTTSLVFPEGFETCSGISSGKITELVFPNSTTSLGIIKCSALQEFVVPEGVTALSDKAFDYCSSLTTITLPRGLTSISTTGNTSFFGTTRTNLKTVIYTGKADDAILTDVLGVLTGATVTIENHCNVYYDGVHKETTELTKYFENGTYVSRFIVESACGNKCGVSEEVDSAEALVKLLGYSKAEYTSSSSISNSFVVNNDAIAKYNTLVSDEEKISAFGLIAASKEKIAEENEGLLMSASVKASVDFTSRGYDIISMKITNIAEANYAKELYCTMYICVNGKYYYANNTDFQEKATVSVTYSGLTA
ncbi:MAG: leucine-rich repeat domain-containing protein [Clostridia bacterium]|nr:leucine-rich repeat domain-containing protein [Clostridia bacterium]